MPRQISKFYESIEDLEKKQRVGVERSPRLTVDWGTNRVLTEADLNRVSQCFLALPSPEHPEKQEPYNYLDCCDLPFLTLA